MAAVVRSEVGSPKNGEASIIPLAPGLFEVLKLQRERTTAEFSGCHWMFHFQGDRITWFYKPWAAARVSAGLIDDNLQPNRVFHDLRRSGVRKLVRAGVPESVAQRISGQISRTAFERYNIVGEANIRQGAMPLGEHLGRVEVAARTELHTIDAPEAVSRVQ